MVSVDRDSILFLGIHGKPHTAWLHRQSGGQVLVHMADGFSGVPPDDLHPKVAEP